MVTIVMGVSGSGKTFIGTRLADQWKLPFYDADDFHSDANKQKMQDGVSLIDTDREMWLRELSEHIRRWNQDTGAVLACSALKKAYRRTLSDDFSSDVQFVYLHGDRELIRQRMQARHHFFNAELLDSQFDTLEEPDNALTEESPDDDRALWISIDQSPEAMVKEIGDTVDQIRHQSVI